jgi:hypothetical protein
MTARIKHILSFINEHRWFMLFVTSGFLLNLFLLLQNKNERTEFLTCSTYDKGPLGTYGLFRDLEDRGVPVRRTRLPLFREIDSTGDRRKTLLILSPQFTPRIWEWKLVFDWVAKGNRLITSGVFGPKRSGWVPNLDTVLKVSRVPSAPSYVLLPIDTVFPYDDTLDPLSPERLMSFLGKVYKYEDTVSVRHFTSFGPDVLPFLSHAGKPTAVKKAVGRGEWIAFTSTNPFGNSVLRDSSWYRFAVRLFTGDGRYSGKALLFDEFHNGYKATRSLWQLLGYYEFNSGIIYLSAIILLYLFLTGIRIVSPAPGRGFMHMDALPGMMALAGLLIKFGAWTSLLKREAAKIGSEPALKSTGPAVSFLQSYLNKKGLPPGVKTPEELSDVFSKIETSAAISDRMEAVRIFNILMFMRKELRS